MLPKTLFSAAIASLTGACLLTGCVSSFTRFYEPAANARGPAAAAAAAPQFKWSSDPVSDGKELAGEGYTLIGTSSFIGSNFHDQYVDQEQAMTQGVSVGAAVVLLQVDLSDVVAGGCCVRLFASYWSAGQP